MNRRSPSTVLETSTLNIASESLSLVSRVFHVAGGIEQRLRDECGVVDQTSVASSGRSRRRRPRRAGRRQSRLHLRKRQPSARRLELRPNESAPSQVLSAAATLRPPAAAPPIALPRPRPHRHTAMPPSSSRRRAQSPAPVAGAPGISASHPPSVFLPGLEDIEMPLGKTVAYRGHFRSAMRHLRPHVGRGRDAVPPTRPRPGLRACQRRAAQHLRSSRVLSRPRREYR